MDWKMLLACITGSVEEELLLRNEYLGLDQGIGHFIRSHLGFDQGSGHFAAIALKKNEPFNPNNG